MADSYIQIAEPGSGPKLDTEQLTVGANTVQRERLQIAGDVAAAILKIINTDPSGTDYGIATRQIEVVDPKSSTTSDSAVAAGGQATLDSSNISSSKTGKLLRLIVSASVPFKVTFQTVVDDVATTRIVDFSGTERAWRFFPPSKESFKITQSAGAGFDGFRAVVTNLDTSQSADLYASFMWDEVAV